MTQVPAEEPPPWVTQRTLWRLAACVIRDHQRAEDRCVRCAGTWPCAYRTLAERALREAMASRPRRRVRNPAHLEWLRQFRQGSGGP